MTPKPLKPDPLEAGNGTETLAPSTGALNLREDVLQGFLAIREQHQQLEGILHQVMRRVVLPRCKTIGAELARIRDLYPKGKKGPGGAASRFFSDAEQFTGLKKAQVLNYITVSTSWPRLMDYVADLPEGAAPIQSMRGALEAIRAMNRPERPALPGSAGAVDVDAETVNATDTTATRKRTRYVHSAREKVLPALTALQATPIGLKHGRQLESLLQALHNLLDAMEVDEQGAAWQESPEPAPAPVAAPEVKQPEPAPEPAAAANPPEDLEPEPSASSTLPSLFSATAEGWEAMEAHMAEHGTGRRAAAALGVRPETYSRHRTKLKKALGLDAPAASAKKAG
jgi:hypothetical protein